VQGQAVVRAGLHYAEWGEMRDLSFSAGWILHPNRYDACGSFRPGGFGYGWYDGWLRNASTWTSERVNELLRLLNAPKGQMTRSPVAIVWLYEDTMDIKQVKAITVLRVGKTSRRRWEKKTHYIYECTRE